jgi:hypothetical protein
MQNESNYSPESRGPDGPRGEMKYRPPTVRPSRLVEGNEPRFDIDKAYGAAGESEVLSIIEALERGRVEVKHDSIWARTGNIYVEWICRHGPNGNWFASGLQTTEADVWAFVLGETRGVLCVATDTLREFCRARVDAGGGWNDANPALAYCTHGSRPTKGVKVNLVAFLRSLDAQARGDAA